MRRTTGSSKTTGTSRWKVVHESREMFDHVEHAIAALSDDDLFLPHQYSWLQGAALAPVVVKGAIEHYRVAHEREIRA